ncbi:MAG: McrC family protein [Butyrivibrio sp.]|nr:McrC family protein [Butyrivibrio sp.]
MADRIILRKLEDWSQLNRNDSFFKGIDMSRDENFGLHIYNGNLWTSGYVGVGRLYGANGRTLATDGKEHIVVINPKYNVDPWIMLEKVMTDAEYDDYLAEMEIEKKYLFKIFYDQPVIKLAQDQGCDADILYALSFVNLCYSLCKKGIKKKMIHKEENLISKVRGKIDIQKNIRKNTFNGRNDRFFCKYIDFTSDVIENRILKATLLKCKNTIERKFKMESGIVSRLYYCLNALRSVKLTAIKNRDFNNASVTGLYTYYKPLLKLAKCILNQKYMSYTAENGDTVARSVYTIPYMINMETIFEFYVRTIFREMLDPNKYYLEDYSKKVFLQKGAASTEDSVGGIHLMPYCIPDIIICDKNTGVPVMVLDAKYKRDDRAVRADCHQLLSYVLLTGVDKCGFVLPGSQTVWKQMLNGDYIELATPLMQQLKYYELILGNTVDRSEMLKMV